jgi:hypothetical protein
LSLEIVPKVVRDLERQYFQHMQRAWQFEANAKCLDWDGEPTENGNICRKQAARERAKAEKLVPRIVAKLAKRGPQAMA